MDSASERCPSMRATSTRRRSPPRCSFFFKMWYVFGRCLRSFSISMRINTTALIGDHWTIDFSLVDSSDVHLQLQEHI